MSAGDQGPLSARLAAWARAFGGEQFVRLGYSSIDRLGDAPANDADYGEGAAIERIVQAMAQSGRWKEARVLRAEYFLSGLPEPARLRALKRKGCDVSRTAYYVYLASAQAFVAGALASEARPLADRIAVALKHKAQVTTTDLVVELQLGDPSDRSTQMAVARAMRALGWEKFRPWKSSSRSRVWRRSL